MHELYLITYKLIKADTNKQYLPMHRSVRNTKFKNTKMDSLTLFITHNLIDSDTTLVKQLNSIS